LDDVRSVLRLEGRSLLDYLQKVVSSDATKLAAPGAPPLYACVLTPQGRYLHDMFLHRVESGSADTQAVLVDCDAGQRRSLMDLLQRYSLHHKIDVTSASKNYSVWAAFGSGISGASAAPEREWPSDPRLPALGRRAILPRGSAPAPTASASEYACWRIKQGVAEGDAEIPSGEVVPLEYNLDKLNGISFEKGCYVGQEFVARVHALGVVRKRIMPFRLGQARGASCLSTVPLAPGVSRIFDVFDAEENLRPIGKVRALQGEFGLAKLRLKEAMAAIREEKPLLVGDLEAGTGYAEVWPWRPEWWEPSWGYEEGFEEEKQRQVA
jgi:folate-binding protein YgfZ